MSPYANASFSNLLFKVTYFTIGYYWCKITNTDNTPLRLSIITPVLQPSNTSLPQCTSYSVDLIHNFKSGPECAAEGSPITYTRALLPTCPLVINIS